jgi:hypothetical protein
MTSKSRVSVSLKGITFKILKDYCDANHLKVLEYIDDILNERLDALGVPKAPESDSNAAG